MNAYFGSLAAISGALGVAAGAFGAHGLKDRVEERMLDIWGTAAQYQLIHALALLAVAMLMGRNDATSLNVAGHAFFWGTLIFSGSLYALVLSGQTWLGAFTPIGGTAFIVGWVAVAVALWP
ncbi:MAG: DUF423 domain-containing protein [Myxococcales bacterium]|nr:DUF423 domain-containing protein [Myxococcales bacterium]